VEECGPCPDLASFTLVFALQLRKKHGKISVMISLRDTFVILGVVVRPNAVKL
jgi:hypothetical protein